jgi:hypothetical protein
MAIKFAPWRNGELGLGIWNILWTESVRRCIHHHVYVFLLFISGGEVIPSTLPVTLRAYVTYGGFASTWLRQVGLPNDSGPPWQSDSSRPHRVCTRFYWIVCGCLVSVILDSWASLSVRLWDTQSVLSRGRGLLKQWFWPGQTCHVELQ